MNVILIRELNDLAADLGGRRPWVPTAATLDRLRQSLYQASAEIGRLNNELERYQSEANDRDRHVHELEQRLARGVLGIDAH